MARFLTRFAPSPTGYLHIGHAYSAYRVWQAAARVGGDVLLRIEDIDTTRCRPELTEAILEDLTWLGFDWPQPVRVQSDHFKVYAATVSELARRGLAYRCFRTRADLQALLEPVRPLTPEAEAEHLAAGKPFAWRLSLNAVEDQLEIDLDCLTFTTEENGKHLVNPVRKDKLEDIVIARKDSPSAYHLAATHDDHLQGVTHIVRGEDLIDAPHIQTVLQTIMGWAKPIYIHHPLIMGDDGKRLSKRDQSASLRDLRAAGLTPDDIWKRVGVG
ncbi:MAG: tRNA glutamyl-Q(34) synthetase GluQRS [Pseudomonadota bacterium]